MKKRRFLVGALLALVAANLFAQTSAPEPVVLQIDAAKITAHVSPTLYGLMTEEINYSYDGGLYAELVRNRTFQDNAENPVHWSLVADGGGAGTIALDRTQPLNDALPVSLKLDVTTAGNGFTNVARRARVGVANDGFWGVAVRPNTRYRASFYAKATENFSGSLTVTLESNDATHIYASAEVPRVSLGWHRYEVTLTTSEIAPTSATNRLVILTGGKGTVWFSLVSLFPPTFHDRLNGNRPDIMQLLADMKPAFLRFPGGNYLQGRTLATRFPWKKTLGDLADRPGHLNDSWNYRSSDGMGLLEFLEWCEDLNIQPVLGVFAGFTLRGVAAKPGPELDPFVQEALEEIEYVTGGTNTTWGARRAQDGHPTPFKLTYVEIGNEDNFDRVPGSYDARFTAFYDAIKAKHPELQIIATIPVKTRVPDAVDEHFYPNNPKQFPSMVHRYDTYDRKGPKVFVGEWATRMSQQVPTPNLECALSDAAWMTGMERNSDLVIMSCYAPLFVNVSPGAMQWRVDLIGYDALGSYGSPAYYAQQMFSRNHGDVVLSATADHEPTEEWQPPAPRPPTPPSATPTTGAPAASGTAPAPAVPATPPPLPPKRQIPVFFQNVTRDSKSGTIFVKLVNTVGTPQSVRVELAGVASVAPDGEAITLKGASPTDTNSITEPTKLVPIETKISGLAATFTREVAPYSITILKLHPR